MIAKVVVVVAGKEGKNEATPQFAEVASDIVAKLPDAIGQQRVSTWICLGETQQSRSRNKRNTIPANAIKPGDDRDAVSLNRNEPVFRNLNARLCGKCFGTSAFRQQGEQLGFHKFSGLLWIIINSSSQ